MPLSNQDIIEVRNVENYIFANWLSFSFDYINHDENSLKNIISLIHDVSMCVGTELLRYWLIFTNI